MKDKSTQTSSMGDKDDHSTKISTTEVFLKNVPPEQQQVSTE